MSTMVRSSIVILVATTVISCRPKQSPPFDPAAIRQDERELAGQVEPYQLEPLPAPSPLLSATQPTASELERLSARPATRPLTVTEETLPLSLREIVHRAIANNYEIRVEAYEPAIEQTRVIEQEARFDPRFFTEAFYSRTETPGNLTAFEEANVESYSVATGIRQELPTGGEAELRYQPQRRQSFPAIGTTPDPVWTNELALQLRQPLLRNFGGEINRARIRVARNNQRISLLDFREAVETQMLEIEQNYWELVLAVQTVKILENQLDRTLETSGILQARAGQDVTRVQLAQAQARVEQRRRVLVRARARVRDLSDTLKQLMNDPDLPVTSPVLVLPADVPLEEPLHFDLEDQIETALENRLELAQQLVRIDSAAVAREVARNNLLPQFDLTGTVGVQGSGEDFDDSLSDLGDGNFIDRRVGFEFEVPLGNRGPRAIYRRAILQRQQAIENYKGLVDRVALDVKTAMREVATSWEAMVATRRERLAAADEELALLQREEVGEPLTPDFVQRKLDAQERLATAQQAEVEAIASYNLAIARLERAKGTLMPYNDVILDEEDLPVGRAGD